MPLPLLIMLSVLLNVCGQLAIKFGTKATGGLALDPANLLGTLAKISVNPLILAGLGLYAVSALFWIAALSRADLSYAYPFLSVGYVLVVLLSAALLHESLTPARLAGVVLIAAGLAFISRS